MSIKKQDSKWLVDVRPDGRNGKRYRKAFDTKAEAQRFEKYTLANHHNKPWLDKPVDKRRLSELIEQWFLIYGQQLKTGARARLKLNNLCRRLNNPLARHVDKKMFLEYRAQRLLKVTPSTVKEEQTLLSSVFTQLIKSDDWGEHPIAGLGLVKSPARELSFLYREDIDKLLSLLSGDAYLVALISLSTGARWGEAQGLTGSQVQLDRVTFVDTKNGKNRTVPISHELYLQLPKKSGRLFSDCYTGFLKILKGSGIELPKGQAAHVLRHTFASHFVMNGGNILTLQKILGHGDIKITMGYAHLAPDHLLDVLDKNPIAMTTV